MTTDAPIIDARDVTYSLEVAGRPLHILKGVSLRVAPAGAHQVNGEHGYVDRQPR